MQFECQSTGRTRIRFEPERTFGSFKKILDYARRVSNRDDGSSSGVEHTFDLQFKKFNSMNNLLFYLRRVRYAYIQEFYPPGMYCDHITDRRTETVKLDDGRSPLQSEQTNIRVKHSNKLLDVCGSRKTEIRKV